MASVPLASDHTVDVYAVAERRTPYILVAWGDNEDHKEWAWIPADKVRRVTDSEWDI